MKQNVPYNQCFDAKGGPNCLYYKVVSQLSLLIRLNKIMNNFWVMRG